MGVAYWPKKLLGGYPGLAATAVKIAEYIPACELYVEPFAGLGRLNPYIKAQKIVLNDRSQYAYDYLRAHYRHHTITQTDFVDCINTWDSSKTFFLIDPPWITKLYGNNDKCFIDRTAEQYYTEVLDIVKRLKANWILCSQPDNPYVKNVPYNQVLIESDKRKNRIFGLTAKTLITGNYPLISNQTLLA